MKKQIFILSLLFCGIVSAWGQVIASEYCQEDMLPINNKYIAMTWQTVANGNVEITLEPGTSATTAEYRDGGFEGGIEAFIVSTDNFVTETPASNYFTFEKVYSGHVATLVKIAELPADAKIKHIGAGHALAWKLDGGNQWDYPDFVYTYGGVCSTEPVEVQLTPATMNLPKGKSVALIATVKPSSADQSMIWSSSAPNVVTVDENGVVTGKTTGEATITATSNVNEDLSATCVIQVINAPASEYCAESMLEGDNREAAFTWETNSDGDVEITIAETSGASGAHFRGNGLKEFDKFKVGTSKEAGTNYFTPTPVGTTDKFILKLKDAANAPALGTKIYYDGVVEYDVAKDGNAWPTLQFEYTYGGVCTDGISEVRLNPSLMTVSVGKNRTLTASVLPSKAPQTVTWSSDDEEIATVDENGVVTGMAAGEVIIRATSTEDIEVFGTCTVTVAAAIPVGRSEFCSSTEIGNNKIALTWKTLQNGDIEVSIEPWGESQTAEFRNGGFEQGLKGMKVSMDNFQTEEDASNYFAFTNTGDGPITKLVSIAYLPEGAKIKYTCSASPLLWRVDNVDVYDNSGTSHIYTYGSVCSGYAVTATVNDANMGTAIVKKGETVVTAVEEGDNVTFIATPNDGYVFSGWYQGETLVSRAASYNVDNVQDNVSLQAQFHSQGTIYCHTKLVCVGESHSVYLTMLRAEEDVYKVIIDCPEEMTGFGDAYIGNVNGSNIKLNDASVMAQYVEISDNKHQITITVPSTTPIKWDTPIYLLIPTNQYAFENPQNKTIEYDIPCVDDQAPTIDIFKADVINPTAIRLTIKATDNNEGNLTYTISRENAANIQFTEYSGVTREVDVTDLTMGTEYTFNVVVEDYAGNQSEQTVKVTPMGDIKAPTDVTVTARPLTDKSIELTLFANDDYAGDITYMITSVPSVSIDNVVAPRGTTTKTVVHTLTANTEYTFSVVATDAAGNEAAAVSTSATTFSGNLALNKPTIVGAGDNISFSNDGNMGTRWGSSNNGSHPAKDWWSVNLGAVYDIQNIRIIWEQARPKFYDILVSNDGINWTVAQSYNQLPEYIQDIKTIVDYPITATGRYVKIAATSTEGGYDNLNWGISFWELEAYGTPAVDTEAPVITEFVANGASATSILVRATATDNFCGDLSYTFYCDNVAIATPVVKPAGTEATYVFNNLENKEYTFKVVVSDGTKETTSGEIKASPAADDQAPTGLAVSNIVPEYYRVTFDLSATDDKGGMITYIVKNEDTQVATADAMSGTTASIEVTDLDYLTAYTFTATAQDATGNVGEPINIEFTTTAPPFPLVAAPIPSIPSAFVRSLYSDVYIAPLQHDFTKNAYGESCIYTERMVNTDHQITYNNAAKANQLAWGSADVAAYAIEANEGYTDGTNKGLDVTGMTHIHLDIWSSIAYEGIKITLRDENLATISLDGSGWNSFDLPLAGYSRQDDLSDIRWFKLMEIGNLPYFAMDNVFFYQKYDITLDEAQDNATTISANADKYADVTLNRAFDVDGFNYTLCLPFDLLENQMQEAFGADYKLWKLDDAYMKSAEVLYLDFKEVRDLEAGVPYIFLPTQTFNAGGIFSGVTIKNELHPVEFNVDAFGSVFMTGIYSPYELPEANNYVLGPDNWLYQSDGEEMLGLRCYFTFGSGVSQNVRARAVFHNTDVVTDLETVDGSQCTMRDGKYVINGQFVIIREGKTYNAVGESINR